MNLLRPLHQLLWRWRQGFHVSDIYIYIRIYAVTLQNIINLYHDCCEILKSSKTVPTFLEIVLFPRNGTANKVTEHTIHVNVAVVWSDPFIRLSLDRLKRRTERTKQYYKRCPCRCVSDRQTEARNVLNVKLTRTAHNKYLCAGLLMPQGPRVTSQCKLTFRNRASYI
jgi:hypothetical protein